MMSSSVVDSVWPCSLPTFAGGTGPLDLITGGLLTVDVTTGEAGAAGTGEGGIGRRVDPVWSRETPAAGTRILAASLVRGRAGCRATFSTGRRTGIATLCGLEGNAY